MTPHGSDLPYPSVPVLREPRYSQSLERGLAILGVFRPDRPVLGIAEIADELGMSRSTTHRYVITLVVLGFMEQEKTNSKYRLGLGVTDLGMSALNSTGLREHSHPYLKSCVTGPVSRRVLLCLTARRFCMSIGRAAFGGTRAR